MIPTIEITDYHVYDNGLKTHSRIAVCKEGVLTVSTLCQGDGDKVTPRNLSITWDGINLLIFDKDNNEPLEIISAPYHIIFEKGEQV